MEKYFLKTKEMSLRKSLLLFVLCLFYTVAMFAAKPVTVQSGDVSVIKKPSIALLEINFADTKVGNETLDEYQTRRGKVIIREWKAVIASTKVSLPRFFNKKNRNRMQLTTEAVDASYKFIIHVNELNMGDSFSGTIAALANPFGFAGKAGGVLMNGTIDIIDMKTNNVVCRLNVNGIKGKGNVSLEHRFHSMFNYLSQTICGLK